MNLSLHTIDLESSRFFSDEGRCYTFDSRASGYGRGEGTAAIVIKSLDAAIEDGNPIQAVIHSSVVNQDGKTLGITMPSRESQEAAIEQAYAIAGLNYSDTAYVEAHGTGTKAGDPIETGAIAATLASNRLPEEPLLIGSVKTNLGHTESTSGLAGVIKAILMINKGYVPPNLNFVTPNQNISFEQWKLKVCAYRIPLVEVLLTESGCSEAGALAREQATPRISKLFWIRRN